MEKRVVVTGLGLISSLGNSVEANWKALCEGVSGIGPLQTFDVSAYDARIASEVKGFDPLAFGMSAKDAKRFEKFVQYALASTKQAIVDSGLDAEKEDRERIGVIVGSGIGSLRIIEEEYEVVLKKGPSRISPFLIPSLIVNEAAGHIAITYGLMGPNACVTTACASGSHALGDALRVIQRGDADVMISGGTESCITKLGVGGFCALKALSTRNDAPQKASRPFDLQRDGFVMAEGCGIVVLESLEHAQKRGAKIYAEFAGYGASCDAYHSTAPDPEGVGASLAIKWALKDAGVNPEQVDYINAHGTSTKLNDKGETLAIKKALGSHAKKVMVSSTKSMTGHMLGAAGGYEFVVSCLAVKEDIAPPTTNYEFPDPDCDLDYVPNTARRTPINVALSNSLGFGGHNATLAVKKFTGK
ncbi:MAG TPA: beta-ketoacyl-ACP synthase II [Candidatus Omnitrophota bacterium]|nr:beta-ketoacyl-ACP synthase II [Candidatus Omnitrophota bacterium]HQO37875.1 beta-ketoacyl-ACP synthase II [Candidatus Omnitrophota bacterium]HQQ06699.1 beta-ketoacyl-ACP synthase II [Candidatus Omnitrophota bacterium]